MTDRDRDTRHDELSATDRAHGTHGAGDSREAMIGRDETKQGSHPAPVRDRKGDIDPEQATSQLSGSGWGNTGAGGSVADKREPERQEDSRLDEARRQEKNAKD